MIEQDPVTLRDEALSVEMRELAMQIVPDPTFAHRLAAKLEQSPPRYKRDVTGSFRLWWRAAVAAILIIVIAFATITPLRVWAQAVFDTFFERIASNQGRIVYNEVDINTVPRVTTLEAADALEDQFGFDILLPTAGLEGGRFEEGFYSTTPPFLSLRFHTGEAFIILSQMSAQQVEGESWRQVGASAQVLDTTITRAGSEIHAQYVQGAWAYPLQPGMPTPAPGQGIDTTMTWDSTIPMRRLRWQQGNIIYEVSATAIGVSARLPITFENLVVIAEGMR